MTPDDAQYQTVQWISSDESIADVNSNGTVYVKGTGMAEITAGLKYGEEKKVYFNQLA
ncbi:MAG: Ig-like domain-containing protein [Parasporobacterium sp.]|nr:Ig-like domain-containing protein [Parasporobacterium sp.]